MRMAEIPEQGAPGPEAVPIPAAEEALLLADRQERRQAVRETVRRLHPEAPLHKALLREAPLRTAVPREVPLEVQHGAVREAAGHRLPVIIMKQDVLPPADAAEDGAARIL